MSQTAPEADAGAIPQEHGQASVDPTTPVDSPPPPGLLPAAAASEPSQQDGPTSSPSPDQDQAAVEQQPDDHLRPSVVVRYGLMRQVGEFRHSLDASPRPGTLVVARTERGVELGEVLVALGEQTGYGCVSKQQLAEFLKVNGAEFPFRRDGKILRLANPQDVIDQRHLDSSASEERTFCRQQIQELNLHMKLVAVEHLLGGERIIFYFVADSRVDFRELVRKLASQYRTRIEMRQVGARDEARLVADFERCGRRCCCQQFIKDLKPVSMRMAKIQKATLDPSKISGRCGRLMCCLRFEDETYDELQKKLPRKNTWVRTESVTGRVTDSQILTQLVRLERPDRTQVIVANEEIIERDVEPPPMEEPQEPSRRSEAAPPVRRKLYPDAAEPEPDGEAPADAAEAPEEPEAFDEQPAAGQERPAGEDAVAADRQPQAAPSKKKRHRRRKSRGGNRTDGQGAAPVQPSGGQARPQAPNQGGQSGSASKSRRRRRRRKKS